MRLALLELALFCLASACVTVPCTPDASPPGPHPSVQPRSLPESAKARGDDKTVVVIRAARAFDGVSAEPLRDVTLVVRGHRIEAVGAGVAIPAGARVIDLHDQTVLPGLIDAHTHILA